VEPEDRAEGLDKPGLGETGNADQQGVAAAQQGDQRLLDYLALAKDDFADAFANEVEAAAQRFDLVNEIRRGGVNGCGGSQADRFLFKPYGRCKPDGKCRRRQFLSNADGNRRQTAADRSRRYRDADCPRRYLVLSWFSDRPLGPRQTLFIRPAAR